VPCGSGDPRDRRTVIRAGGIAIGCGKLFVCDAGGPITPPGSPTPRPPRPGRVLVFALPSLALRAILQPPTSAGLGQPWTPVDCALAAGGAVYVADPANGAVHHFNARHAWVEAFEGFGAIGRIAVDNRGWLHTVVPGIDTVRVSDRAGVEIDVADDAATLAAGFPALPVEVTPDGRMDLAPLCRAAGVETDAAWFDAAGNPTDPPEDAGPSYALSGIAITRPLDSAIGDCQWHSIELRGEIPPRARVRIETLTLESDWSAATVASLPDTRWTAMTPARNLADGRWDGLILSPPGRYLWLRVTLEGKGDVTPRIALMDITYPRVSLRRYLPAIYGAEPAAADFTDRLLSIFDSGFRGIERQVDRQAGLYDPTATPATSSVRGRPDFLSWLAAWIGVRFDAALTVAERRRLLKAAGRLLGCTGTLPGLRQKLLVLLGIDGITCCQPAIACNPRCPPPPRPYQPPPLILEHFRLRRWLALGAARLGDTATLWGQRLVNRTWLGHKASLGGTALNDCKDPARDPWHIYAHRLTVFLPAACAATPERRAMIERFLHAELPAHVQGFTEYVRPRLRVGIQASIGFDSVVGCWPQGITLGESDLGRATVLEGNPADPTGPTPAPRVGKSARLG
jgi:phage tail-like protein